MSNPVHKPVMHARILQGRVEQKSMLACRSWGKDIWLEVNRLEWQKASGGKNLSGQDDGRLGIEMGRMGSGAGWADCRRQMSITNTGCLDKFQYIYIYIYIHMSLFF